MNDDGKGDELKKFVSNSGSVDLNLSDNNDVGAIYNYFNSVLKEPSSGSPPGVELLSTADINDPSASSLQTNGSVSDCYYHIRKHGSQIGLRLLVPALNRVLCSDRVSQMTKTYNDVEAVTRLLEENDFESMERTSNVLNRLSKKNSESNDVQFAWSSTEHPEWFQLSGHPDCFAPAGPSTIWKKCSDSSEREVYEALSKEPILQGVIPRYLRTVDHDEQTFIELQDLLHGFEDPNVMDIKMGVRTFLESEVQNTAARQDLYRKMIAIDPSAPTEEENKLQAVTKLRYMQFREEQSSTCSQGFRIEAIKLSGEPPRTNLKLVKSTEEVQATFKLVLKDKEEIRSRLVAILRKIRNKLEQSQYFKNHEVVGSSILIIYDSSGVGAWLIDFAKTRPVPENVTVDHRAPWIPGNHEEGLLFGLDNLIRVLENLRLDGANESVN